MDWNGQFSQPMTLTMHTLGLQMSPNADFMTTLTEGTHGINAGSIKDNGAMDLFREMERIYGLAVNLPISSQNGLNDKESAEILKGAPTRKYNSSEYDLSTVGTIRYDSMYNFDLNAGVVRAIVPYIDGYTVVNGLEQPIIKTQELWNTEDTVSARQGRYLSWLKSSNPGRKFNYLSDQDVIKQLSQINSAIPMEDYINWFMNYDEPNGNDPLYSTANLKPRLSQLGSTVNADLALANKDVLKIDVSPEKMSSSLSIGLIKYLKYKAKNQPANLLIVPENNGAISFLNAQRGLTGNRKAGERDTTYIPQFLAHRFEDIASINKSNTLIWDGRTNLVDARVYQDGLGDMYSTIGLTAMVAGGKSIVGYRVYAASANAVNSSSIPNIDSSDPLDKVIPLFEIVNEGPSQVRTKGFEDLGYTYSGFELFNRLVNNRGQAVAIFGNGFGTDKSVLYFIDAYTGQKLHEIVLDNQGGGAGTPSIIVQSDAGDHGQMVKRIYVGDYSGQLYKVEFQSSDFTDDDSTMVTALFRGPNVTDGNFGQNTISTKPLVVKDNKTGFYNVSFGMGIAGSAELDRGIRSWRTERMLYTLMDTDVHDEMKSQTVTALKSLGQIPTSVYKSIDLKTGVMSYASGKVQNYYATAVKPLTISDPVAYYPNTSDVGWSIRLTGDGLDSGERLLADPMFDSETNTVIFSTFGFYDDHNGLATNRSDPCYGDAAFGKMLGYNIKTGKKSSYHSDHILDNGTINTNRGGLTGHVSTSPIGNHIMDMKHSDKLVENLQDDLVAIVGIDNSSHEVKENLDHAACVNDLYGEVICEKIYPVVKKLQKRRISIQEMIK